MRLYYKCVLVTTKIAETFYSEFNQKARPFILIDKIMSDLINDPAAAKSPKHLCKVGFAQKLIVFRNIKRY